jgi:hypothetical protein
MMKTRFAAAAVALTLALSACATPESRVADRLEQAGLKPHMAHCMAGRLVHRLSRAELRQLGSLPKASHAQSVDEFLYRLRALDDHHIVKVSLKSAALCATGLADD